MHKVHSAAQTKDQQGRAVDGNSYRACTSQSDGLARVLPGLPPWAPCWEVLPATGRRIGP